VPIAAGVLYPVFGLLLSPMIAALAMSLSSVSVVSNALRLATAPLGNVLKIRFPAANMIFIDGKKEDEMKTLASLLTIVLMSGCLIAKTTPP